MGALLLGQRLPEAELIFKRLIAARPNDKRLDVIRALAFGQKKAAARPDWVNTSRGWSDALSKASIQPLLDDREDAATLRSHDDDGLEVFLPTSFEPDPGQAFAFRRGGVVFMVRRVARVTRCEAPACLAEVTNALKTQNVSQLWGAPVVLPSGEGFEGIYEGPVGLVNLIVLPRGGHVYVLSVTGAPSELLAAAPIIRLFRQSFRSRDGSLAGPRAELVHRIAGFVPATLQLRARMLMAQPPRKGCPLTAVLAEATPAERPPLLVDAFLHTSAPVDRRRILSCTKASLPEATALGLAAVWDTDHEVMGFGRSALARHGARIIRLLGTEPALAMDPDSGEPHSPRVAAAGLLQVLLALPTADASRLSMRLLDSGQPKLRAGVLSALHWKPDLVPIVEQARLLREGSAEDAALLGSVLPERLETDERLVAIRARLDRVDAKSPPAEKEWALVVIGRLAARLDAADAVRLARLAEVLDRNETISTIATNHTLPVIVAAHRSGGRMPSTAEAPRDVQALVTGWRDLAQPRSKGVRRGAAAAKLAELPLNPGWSYFRVDHPGAFVAGFSDLGKRM
ncbi:MAG TPA: hypothetical protein VGG33_09140, partial [Polyangia bacterium]